MIWTTLLVLLGGWFPGQVHSEAAKDIGQVHTVAEISERATLQKAFVTVLRDTGMPGGVASAEPGCTLTSRDFHLPRGMRLSNAMESLVASDGRYRWQFADGVIMVFPKEGVPALLTTKISHVHISDGRNLTLALDELLGSDEVRKALALLKAFVRFPEPGFQKLDMSSTQAMKKPLDLTDVSLSGALNILAVGQTDAIWSYSESACNGRKIIQIDFISK